MGKWFSKTESIAAAGEAGSKLLDSAGGLAQDIRSAITGDINPDDAAKLYTEILHFESDLVKVKADIIKTEATSQSWLTRTWRPVVMLGLFTLVMLDSFGVLSNSLAPQAWTIIGLGLGGYVVGRSAEKVVDKLKG